jgi:hypothetical protein
MMLGRAQAEDRRRVLHSWSAGLDARSDQGNQPRLRYAWMTQRSHISGRRPARYESGDCEMVRIQYAAAAEDHADVRRKLAAGWKLGEICGEEDSLFKYACSYPPTATSKPAD